MSWVAAKTVDSEPAQALCATTLLAIRATFRATGTAARPSIVSSARPIGDVPGEAETDERGKHAGNHRGPRAHARCHQQRRSTHGQDRGGARSQRRTTVPGAVHRRRGAAHLPGAEHRGGTAAFFGLTDIRGGGASSPPPPDLTPR